MSLLTNYEGLRHQIERLVRENEELKKLVRLIRENHELTSAIKMQTGGLDISGRSSRPGEAATGPPPHQGNCVFLPPSPAAANESVLEEVGTVPLAPLADMLNSPQPSPAAGPVVSTLMGPLDTLLPGRGPISQSSPLTSLLTGPLSSHLASPVAVPLAGTPASSLGLPSTGPLTPSSPLAGPLAVSQSSPLMDPITGSVALSLSSPLLTSTAAPLGVSQNLPANPMSNLVLSEAPGVWLAEPLQGRPSGSHPSAGGGPAATPEVPLSAEHPQPAQEPEPLSMTSVGAPIQTSTPVGPMGTPSPATAFSYSTPIARTQPGGPQGQAVSASVPSHSITILACVPTPAPQAATSYRPSSTPHPFARTHRSPTRPSPTLHSPAHDLHCPPRASSSPASVNDTRGPRVAEPSRKSIPELERKLAHQKSGKFPDSSRESKQLAWERLVGEIAFQLDRRILSSIFPERVRLYGFTVSNIPEKIMQASLNPSDHKLDEELCQTLTQRYTGIMNRLQSLGYDGRVHPALTEQLVNAYGILRERPERATSEGGSYTVDFLQRVLVETVHPSMLTDALLLLSCLSQLAHDDGKPMFIW
ncbi:speriolin [Physeter macrocephalus]|uniref:Speriolin n=1 Tax=Physeter macrocephalus TaxID=9755 RepID=A0A2Y9FAF4_PHYMC|nr:speriolin [Physeter catodon]|eukprot:XP_007118241.2 speriolin [Physeter catodon]